jgi:hypothetical protein
MSAPTTRNRRIAIGDECPRCGSHAEHGTNADGSMYACSTCGVLWDGADWATEQTREVSR